jgi:hypothetical protein
MAGESHTTTDHDTIRQWIEARNGVPATVTGTAGGGEDAGILRVDFPDYGSGDKLRRIDWDEFFEKFEQAKLAFLYEDETKDGQTSRFSKFISR